MNKPKNIFHKHPNFGELSKDELNLYLDFLAKVMFSLDGFEVWEAENVFSEEDSDKWNKEVIERYGELMDKKRELENEIYGNY